MASKFQHGELRTIMSRFCTGVVVVTSRQEDKPIGFTAQSFVSLSLDPPLVAICPAKSSLTWPRIRDSGVFCINVLSAAQLDLCHTFARSGTKDKFAKLEWHPGVTGSPILKNVIAHVECRLSAEYDAGDHHIAVGLVEELSSRNANANPLLFYGAGYGTFEPLSQGPE